MIRNIFVKKLPLLFILLLSLGFISSTNAAVPSYITEDTFDNICRKVDCHQDLSDYYHKNYYLKQFHKAAAISYYKSYDLPVTILRPFNTFGPRQSARAIIPTIITQLLQKKNVIKLGNLTPTRDFTYIDDTVNAFLNAMKAKKISGEVINIGNKFEISIKDILKVINKDFKYHFDVKIDKKRIRSKNSEVYRLLASNTKAAKILKWRPKYSGLKGFKKGLEKTINWFSEPKNLKYYNSDFYNI